jgi:hypothetical protein
MKAFCVAFLLAFTVATAVQARTCTPNDAEAADAAVDHLDSWADIDSTFRMFGHCDDGSIAEGNSEGIARLLVDKWQTLPHLAALIKRHPPLKAYVLRHVDTTLDTDDLTRIAELAATVCPSNTKPLCAQWRYLKSDSILSFCLISGFLSSFRGLVMRG